MGHGEQEGGNGRGSLAVGTVADKGLSGGRLGRAAGRWAGAPKTGCGAPALPPSPANPSGVRRLTTFPGRVSFPGSGGTGIPGAPAPRSAQELPSLPALPGSPPRAWRRAHLRPAACRPPRLSEERFP
ncbi:MAG: hypothetical protein AMXMBFR53_11730 [Gemmatimonadota bacterium]